MQLAIVLIFILQATARNSYERITDYSEYLNKWKEVVPERYVHDVSDLAMKTEECYGKKCQFFYYEYEDESFTDPVKRKTVLMVAGMHGNQFLGPHTLLYAYGHLKAYRIIYFPMANPSGFLEGKRETVPGKIDPNRDYPIDGNSNCYQTSASHILDMLFRKYKFDLTIVLHNGGSQISFNWGTVTHSSNSHTEDYAIYHNIAEMMQRVGGESKELGLPNFPIGTMDEVIYPAQGTFDDWAYAAGKFPQLITKCTNFQYASYPKDMANGLVFLIEMGPFQALQLGSEDGIDFPPSSSNKDNGFIARGIRILKNLMNVLHPKLILAFENTTASLTVEGCRSAKLPKLVVYLQTQGKVWEKVFESSNSIAIEGDLRGMEPVETKIDLTKPIGKEQLIKYVGTFQCDAEWQGKGSTSFAQPRIYSIDIIEKARSLQAKPKSLQAKLNEILSNFDWKQDFIQIVSIFLFFLAFLCFICYCIFRGCIKKAKIQKFQQVQHIQSQQHATPEGEQQPEGDLHTARGGIIGM